MTFRHLAGQALRKLFPFRMALRDYKRSLERIRPNVRLTREQWVDKIKEQYWNGIGHELNLENPRRYTEKIQWRKLYDDNPLYSRLADKYAVREWVKDRIGEDYLIPLLGAWRRAEDIDFDQLPDSFVLKTNNASGTNIIVRDKKSINRRRIVEQLNRWLVYPFWANAGEFQYRDIPPMIIAEKYMQCEEAVDLTDYKFYCFNGKPWCCSVDVDRYHGHKRIIYDLNWVPQSWTVNSFEAYTGSIEKPAEFERMLELAETLCKGFSFVRVDLYLIRHKVYFGEMTFTPAQGYARIIPDEYDFMLGEQWLIDQDRARQGSASDRR